MKKLMLLFAILFFVINQSYAYEEKGDARVIRTYADNSYDVKCYPSTNVCYISRGSGPAQPGERIYVNFGNEDYRAVTADCLKTLLFINILTVSKLYLFIIAN